MNETLFRSLPHAREILERWRHDYNGERPHSQLGWLTPQAYRATFVEAGRAAAQQEGSAPRPLAPAIDNSSDHRRTLVPTG